MHSLTHVGLSPRRVPTNAVRFLLWPSGGVLLLTLSSVSSQNISLSEFIYSGMFLALSIQAYITWSRTRDIRVPVWPLVCVAHFVFYGVAIFGALRNSPSAFDHGTELPESVLTAAMLVGILGLLSMGAGRKAAMHFARPKALRLPFLEISASTPSRIQVLLLIGTGVNVFGVPFFGTVVW